MPLHTVIDSIGLSDAVLANKNLKVADSFAVGESSLVHRLLIVIDSICIGEAVIDNVNEMDTVYWEDETSNVFGDKLC